MDALDLTSTEKRHKRKANTPQRRNHSEGGESAEGSPASSSAAEYPNTPPSTTDNNSQQQQQSSDDEVRSDGTVEVKHEAADSPMSSGTVANVSPPLPPLTTIPSSTDLNRFMMSISASNANIMYPGCETIYSHHGGAVNTNPLVAYNWQMLAGHNQYKQMLERNGARMPPVQSNGGDSNGAVEVFNQQQDGGVVMNNGFQLSAQNNVSSNNNNVSSTNSRLFINPASYGDGIRASDTPGIPERTKKQNRWAFNVWKEWARKRNIKNQSFHGKLICVPMDVGLATEEELDFWLCKFVVEIRRKDGNPYPAHTLMQIVMGIQRYLRQQAGKPQICILDRNNVTYTQFRRTLDARIKVLQTENGTGNKNGRKNSPNRGISNSSTTPSLGNTNGAAGSSIAKVELGAIPPSLSPPGSYAAQVPALMDRRGLLGNENAHMLLNSVFHYNVVLFKILSVDDHWNLQIEHFKCVTQGEQLFYIEFNPTRVLTSVAHTLSPQRIYDEPNESHCAAKLFRQYLSALPATGKFYRHPVEPSVVDRSIRYSDQWIGKNRIRHMLRDLTTKRGLKRFGGSPPLPLGTQPRCSEQIMNSAAAAAPTAYPRPMFSSSALAQIASFPLAMYYMQQHQQEAREQNAAGSGSASNSVGTNSPASKMSDNDSLQDDTEAASMALVESSSRKRSHSGDEQPQPQTRYVVLSRGGADSQPPVAVPLDAVLPAGEEAAAQARRGESPVRPSEADEVVDNGGSALEDSCLEIKIPKNIRYVTLLKGNKRRVINLE